jgi:ABC-type sugar transport system substrate-binding protein
LHANCEFRPRSMALAHGNSRVRRVGAVGASAFVALLMFVGTSTSTATAQSRNTAAAAGTATAKAVLAASLRGFVSSTGPSVPLTPLKSFNGPTSDPSQPVSHAKIIGVSSCDNPCSYVGDLVGGLAKQYGNGTYTGSIGAEASNWQSLTAEAIQQRPNVILFNGVEDNTITQQVVEARHAGIKTVGVAVLPNVPSSEGYSAYVAVRQDLSYRLMVQAAIANSGGKANILLLESSGYATIDKYVKVAVADVHSGCPKCTITVVKEDNGVLAAPVAMSQLVTSELNALPSVNYILFADDFDAITAAQQAASLLHRHVTLIAQDGSTGGLELVATGALLYDVAVPLQWIAYAGFDAVRRVMNGETPLSPGGWGGGVHTFSKSNLPAKITNQSVAAMLNSYINYIGAYDALWAHAK